MGQCCGRESKPITGEIPAQDVAVSGTAEPGTEPAAEAKTESAIDETSSKPVVFVIGATGKVGSATLKSLSEKFADKVEIRAGLRNIEKADKFKEMTGVTVVQATMGDKESLKTTLKDVSALFIVTPGHIDRAQIAISTAEAAKEAGVKHIVVVSVPTVELPETVYGKQFSEIEQGITALEVPVTMLRLPYFMDNFYGFAQNVKDESQFSGATFSGEKHFTAVLASDAGLAAATILVDPSSHAGKTYNIISCRVSMDDFAAALSEALEKEVKFATSTKEATKESLLGAGVPEWQADGLLDFFDQLENETPVTNPEDIGDFKAITGQEGTDLKAFVSQAAESFK